MLTPVFSRYLEGFDNGGIRRTLFTPQFSV